VRGAIDNVWGKKIEDAEALGETGMKPMIAVVHGGTSAEKAASTASADFIARGLVEKGHEVKLVEFDAEIAATLRALRPQLVFVAVQGKHHGDGFLQSICEDLQLPYTGTKAVAAALINDKNRSKELCRSAGIRTPEHVYLTRQQFASLSDTEVAGKIEGVLAYPMVAKAVGQGGGYGLAYLAARQDLARLGGLFDFDEAIIVEAFVHGTFITSSILEDKQELTVLAPLSLRQDHCSLDPIEAYNRCYEIVEPNLSPAVQAEIDRFSREVFRLFGAKAYARIDLIMEAATGFLNFIEINAVPGLKPSSFYPQAALRRGLLLPDLLEIIINSEIQGGIGRA